MEMKVKCPPLFLMIAAALASGLFLSPARAQESDPPRPFAIILYMENDSAFKTNNSTDRHYTNGVAFSVTHQPQWADTLAQYMPFADAFGQAETAFGYNFGQLIFTPDNVETRTLNTSDRPYAGYLYGGVYFQRADPKQTTLDHFQLDLGVVGPSSLAESIQRNFHTIIDSPEPKGWDNQLGDEFAAQFYFRKKWKPRFAAGSAWDGAIAWDAIPQVGFALGTVYRNAEAGLTLRLGHNLPNDFGPGRLADLGSATGGLPKGWSLFAFSRVTGRAVEHNLFLEGSTYRDSHSVQEEPLVGEGQLGVMAQYQTSFCTLQVGYSQTFTTREFKSQEDSDSFGAITISMVVEY